MYSPLSHLLFPYIFLYRKTNGDATITNIYTRVGGIELSRLLSFQPVGNSDKTRWCIKKAVQHDTQKLSSFQDSVYIFSSIFCVLQAVNLRYRVHLRTSSSRFTANFIHGMLIRGPNKNSCRVKCTTHLRPLSRRCISLLLP